MGASERLFRVMGCSGHLFVVGSTGVDSTGLAALAQHRLANLERSWTRFDERSDLSRLNRSEGGPTPVGPDLLMLVLRSIDAWHTTGGAFDPTMLAELELAGYTGCGAPSVPAEHPGCRGISVDRERSVVSMPPDLRLDPGGIGKGLAADLVAEELIAMGAAGVLVNLGGDLRVIGDAPDERGWSVAVEDPFDADRTVAVLHLDGGGMATTTPDHRTWVGPDGSRRHLIDPTTRRPSATDVASVTVLAGKAWMAEAVAKAASLAGTSNATDVIEAAGLDGLVISATGELTLTSRLGAFL